MRFVYVMDPLESVLPDKDTTFAFMRSAQNRGHENFHCLVRDLSIDEGVVITRARPAFVSDTSPHFSYGEPAELPLHLVDAVFVRKDPPFDSAYLNATLMLELLRDRTLVLNDPRGLRDANEKLFALHFPRWIPATCVTSKATRIFAFLQSMNGRAVIKPLHGAGGSGVLLLSLDDINARSIVDMLTLEGSRQVMVQEYLPAVRQGDKRVLVLDGHAIGAILRVPRSDDLRANIHVGGSVVETELTAVERHMVDDLAPILRAHGLVFVGLDVIGERLTEVNVTSPTGIQELGRLTGSHPEDLVIAWVEQHAFRYM